MSVTKTADPYIYRIKDNSRALHKFEKDLRKKEPEAVQDIILNFLTVYLHEWSRYGEYDVYVGESGDIIRRTKEHYAEMNDKEKWQYQLKKKAAELYMIGHEHFNKSLTMDIENRLMLYLMSAEKVRKLHNQKKNPQRKYYPMQEFDSIFSKIWAELRRRDPDLFPDESQIKDSAIFKASPLHRLTDEQMDVQNMILQKVKSALKNKGEHQLIFVEGEAGTGKTVLNSSTFYELYNRAGSYGLKDFKCHLLVNHNEQITVYRQIAKKLGIIEKYGNVVDKPTIFINHHTEEDPVDVAFVDEGHLLLTQGKQSYTGKCHLADIISKARVTVVMFDENQTLTAEQYWEPELLDEFRKMAEETDSHIELKNQLRICADKATIDWIDAFTKELQIRKIPRDSQGYEIRIFDRPEELEDAVRKKALSKGTSLSRLVATYDWEYSEKDKAGARKEKKWEVVIGDWRRPWNREVTKELSTQEKRENKTRSWAEQPQTLNEVGSTFTIQGFDLNYVGVILGPSVKFRDGRIQFDPKKSRNRKAVQKHTLSDGTKKSFREELL